MDKGFVNADEIRLELLKQAEVKRDFRIKLAECYESIYDLARTYLDMPDDYYHVITTWIIGTYFHESYPAYPYLFFNAMRGSGKTRALKFISALGSKGDGSVQNNLTEAVLFRIPRGTTTCIDEVEQIGSKDKQTLRELLNAAYKKGMKVKRMKKVKTPEGEQQKVESFEPYYPIAMANIWGMDEVLGDRSITLVLEKSDKEVVTLLFEDFDNEEFQELKRTLEKFSVVSDVDVAKTIYREWNNWVLSIYTTTYNTPTTLSTLTTLNTTDKLQKVDLEEIFLKIRELGISGRNFELLMPLLLVNQMISKEHFVRFLKIGKDLMSSKKQDEYASSKDVTLYDFVANWVDEKKEFKTIKTLVSEFRMFCGDGEQDDKWLNERWMIKALTRLCLVVQKRRISSGTEVILNKQKAKEKILMFKERTNG